MKNSIMQISKHTYRFNEILIWVIISISIPGFLLAQDLEPRFLSPAPVGMNFLALAYSYSDGNVLHDHSIPLENTNVKMNAISLAFARSIDIFGLSGRISAAIPIATATWFANLNGVDTSTTRTGLTDPLIVIATNFIGAPALKGKEFLAYKQNTSVGVSLKLRVPIGQYNDEKIFNLGTNRWTMGVRLGVSHKISQLVLEAYLNALFFTSNANFYGGNTVSQDPLYAVQLHLTYIFSPGLWAAASFGQNYGGETTVNGVAQESTQKNNRWEVTLAIPLSSAFSLKFAYAGGITTRYGANLEAIFAIVQYRWGGL